MFTAAKDKMTSTMAKAYVNSLIKTYGRVDELSVDSTLRRIELGCTLEGEVDRIEVRIEKYDLERHDGKSFVTVLECSSSRPWLQAAMRAHLIGRRLELPSWAAGAL